MKLIFGGAHQGKLDYAKIRFNPADDDIYYCDTENTAAPIGKKVIYEIDKWILALIRNGKDTEQAIRGFIDSGKDMIVICNDISCGVVPVDPILRKWRDATGRALAGLSQVSDEVIRLFCGIPSVLKQAENEKQR